MTEERVPPAEPFESVEERVRESVRRAGDIRGEVEKATHAALSSGRVNLEQVRAVATAVGRGAVEGAEAHADTRRGREAVSEAISGLERALVHSTQATRLALEEASGKVESWGRDDLRLALEDMRRIEPMMLDSLREAAGGARRTGAEVLGDLVRHAQRNGTVVGAEVESSLRALASGLPEALRETAREALGAARESSARAVDAASGAIAGVADVLRGEERGKKPGGEDIG